MNSINDSNEQRKSSNYSQAMSYCNKLIAWYEKIKTRQRLAFQASQILIIVLSGITPILILVGNIPELWQAVPPAIVTILVGLGGIFQWKENYLRFAYASQALQSERIRFDTRSSSDYNRQLEDEAALERFITRVDNIVMGEVGEWRELMKETSDTQPDE